MPTDLLCDLIRIPSVSRDSNVAVAERCVESLSRLGFQIERLPYTDAYGVEKLNIAAVRPGRARRTGGFAYFGHTDVVPASEWTGPGGPFDPAICDGRIYGRGSVDMKGSIAAMLEACGRVSGSGEPVYLILTADEEAGMAGADEVVARSEVFRDIVAGQPHAVIGEPTGGQVVNGHKGVAIFDVVADGSAGHSATREGDSATLRLMAALSPLRQLADELETDARWHDPRFEPPTARMNVLLSDAAPAINITSERASARILVRVAPAFDVARFGERLSAICGRFGLRLERTESRPPMFRPGDSDAVAAFLTVAGGRPATVPYGTDGCCFGEVERLVVLGPGSILQAHTSDEFISVSNYESGIDLYTRCITKFAGSS